MLAVQCCYACTIRSDYRLDSALVDFLDCNNIPNINSDFDEIYYRNLVENSLDFFKISDKKIESYLADNWTLNRLPKVVFSLLVVSCYEICNNDESYVPIIIDDFLEIAKLLNHGGELGFVNSVLDKIAKEHFGHLRSSEK